MISRIFIFTIAITLVLLLACSDKKPIAPIDDTPPPMVTSTTPAKDAVDVPLDTPIMFYFSKNIKQLYAMAANIYINPPHDVTLVMTDTSVGFSLDIALLPSMNYTVIIEDIEDVAGNLMLAPDTLTFTTIHEQIPPYVLYTYPPNGSNYTTIDTFLQVMFSEPLDPATVNSNSVTIDPPIPGTVSLYNNNAIWFTPSQYFEYSTTYNLTISTDITDTLGNHMEHEYVLSTTTLQQPLGGNYFYCKYKIYWWYGTPNERIEVYNDYELRFTSNTYESHHYGGMLCRASGEFEQRIDSVIFIELNDGCFGYPFNTTYSPTGSFYYEFKGDSLYMNQVVNGVRKELFGHVTK